MFGAAINPWSLLAEMPVRRMDDAHGPSLLSDHTAYCRHAIMAWDVQLSCPIGASTLLAQCRILSSKRPVKSRVSLACRSAYTASPEAMPCLTGEPWGDLLKACKYRSTQCGQHHDEPGGHFQKTRSPKSTRPRAIQRSVNCPRPYRMIEGGQEQPDHGRIDALQGRLNTGTRPQRVP